MTIHARVFSEGSWEESKEVPSIGDARLFAEKLAQKEARAFLAESDNDVETAEVKLAWHDGDGVEEFETITARVGR